MFYVEDKRTESKPPPPPEMAKTTQDQLKDISKLVEDGTNTCEKGMRIVLNQIQQVFLQKLTKFDEGSIFGSVLSFTPRVNILSTEGKFRIKNHENRIFLPFRYLSSFFHCCWTKSNRAC